MAKSFVIQCPDCGKYVEVQTGFFAKKTAKCSCGRVINVKTDKMTTKTCPHCGNVVMYDQSKGTDAVCPVCHNKLNTEEDLYALVHFTCPSCAAPQTANKNAETHTCTLCGTVIDVKKRLAQEEHKKSGNASVIKWETSNDVFVWKHPIEDFTLGSQLIVNASQEALLFRDGVAFDLFGAGRYTLEKNVIPALNDIYKLPEDSDVAIHSEVYFINKAIQTGIRWGTPSKVRIMEPTLNLPVEIGARGSFNLEVIDSRTLITKLVGTTSGFAQSEVNGGGTGYGIEYVREKFADMIAMNVTSLLARIVTENAINLLTIDTMKAEIARLLRSAVNNGLLDFGLQIPEGQFYVTDIVTPDDDPNYIRMKKQYLSSLDFKDAEIEARRISSNADLEIARRQADARIRMVDAQTEADVAKVSAQGLADSAKIIAGGASDSVVIEAKGEAERIKLEGHAAVDVYRDKSNAEADALTAKGGNYEQETTRIVNTAIAENGITVVNIEGLDKWTCSACGKTGITSNFCPDCGARKFTPPATWNCSCGKTGITSKFCPDCGARKPE